ncbi:MAG: glutaredoxin domain-containing protein [Bacteroidota bacterium]
MRYSWVYVFLLFVSLSTTAQDVVIEAKDMGSEVVLMATNNEDSDVTVTVELDAKGYDVGNTNKIEVLIPKKQTIEVGRYKRDKSETASFQYGYSLTKTTKSSKKSTQRSSSSTLTEVKNFELDDPALSSAKGVSVYSINKCGRCNYTVEFLESNNIAFVEKNMDQNDEYNAEAFRYLEASGFGGGSFRTPLIVHDGKISYNIKDLKGFLNELKSGSK